MLTPEDIASLKGDEAFCELLTLGRICNALRAVTSAGYSERDDHSRSERNRASLFLLLTGLLSEAFPVLERSGRHFRKYDSWNEHVRPILIDKDVQQLRSSFLVTLRNQAVFHNDPEVSRDGFDAWQAPTPHAFVRGSTDQTTDTYYPLADLVAVVFVASRAGQDRAIINWLRESMSDCFDLATRIVYAIDAVAIEFLADRGYEWEDLSEAG